MTGIRARLAAEGLDASRWSNGPGDQYAEHRHDYDKVLVAEEGSVVFGLPEHGRSAELRAGDRLELPAGTLHDAHVGPDGVACLEAHLPGGTLASEPVLVDGWGRHETATSRGA